MACVPEGHIQMRAPLDVLAGVVKYLQVNAMPYPIREGLTRYDNMWAGVTAIFHLEIDAEVSQKAILQLGLKSTSNTRSRSLTPLILREIVP